MFILWVIDQHPDKEFAKDMKNFIYKFELTIISVDPIGESSNHTKLTLLDKIKEYFNDE
jgi:hypothetical protein